MRQHAITIIALLLLGLGACFDSDELGGVEGEPCSAGTCSSDLVCTLSEECGTCPAGTPGCPCDAGTCVVGSCTEGTDLDGGTWSICYPADLIPCGEDFCPGDAHCTDDLRCAWLN